MSMDITHLMDEASLRVPPADRRWNTGSGLGAVGRGVEQLTADIVVALKTVYNPEIPADIYELALIYKIDIDDDRNVVIVGTLTAPGCPVAGRDAAMGRERGRMRYGRRSGEGSRIACRTKQSSRSICSDGAPQAEARQ